MVINHFFFFPLSASELNLLRDLTLHLVNNCKMRLKIAVPSSINGGVDCNAKDFTLPMDQVRCTKNSWFRDFGNDKDKNYLSSYQV